MNKIETREVAKIKQYHAAGLGVDFVARAMSALIRAARTDKSKAALLSVAADMGCAQHPEFIV